MSSVYGTVSTYYYYSLWPLAKTISLRSYIVSKQNVLLTSIVILLVLAQFAITITYFAVTYPLTEFTQLISGLPVKVARGMSTTIACVETIVGCVLIYLLHTNRSGLKHSDSAINRLIYYTIASGLATGFDAILGTILDFALPQTDYYFLFFGLGAKRLSFSSLHIETETNTDYM